ncbi:YoaK family protein [Streptacidiphilus carbonis]|jgi:uncharacterized membrane protein YoaK (UPF0700 family)|uniref:YoaK family protein n=1 Tax=Streptacidiphilus carbonis TaxID=105422 RepID=UPI0005A85BDE|nr:YoaK family protein [Streptacidiphilus carbonis]
MPGFLSDARATLVPDLQGRQGPLPPLLIALTVVTGLVDAFSYLVLGRVFVANMTGNVVFMAFSMAGSKDFSLTASLTALVAFAAGALLGGRLVNRFPEHRGRLLLAAVATETVLVLASYVAAELSADPASGWVRYLLVVLLGVAMGSQNAAARRLAVPDLTTTVLTLTITGIAADGRLAGGADSKAGRRLLSAASMFVGALVGGALALHGSVGLPLLLAGVLLTGTTALLTPHTRSALPWTQPG